MMRNARRGSGLYRLSTKEVYNVISTCLDTRPIINPVYEVFKAQHGKLRI